MVDIVDVLSEYERELEIDKEKMLREGNINNYGIISVKQAAVQEIANKFGVKLNKTKGQVVYMIRFDKQGEPVPLEKKYRVKKSPAKIRHLKKQQKVWLSKVPHRKVGHQYYHVSPELELFL